MTQLSLLESVSSVPPVIVSMGLPAAAVTKARTHVVASRADESDHVEPRDDFDEFLQAQLRRVRGRARISWSRVARARSMAAKAAQQAPRTASRLASDVEQVIVKGHVAGLTGPKVGAQE